jgi:ADP-heptose:LPS heptosyltransferase
MLDEAGITGEFLMVADVARAEYSGGAQTADEERAQSWKAAMLESLAARWPVILTGLTSAAALMEQLRPGAHPVVDFGGRTDLPTLAALYERATLFCGPESGALHLAAALGKPVVALSVPPDWHWSGPLGVPRRAVCASADDTMPAPTAVASAVRELIGV